MRNKHPPVKLKMSPSYKSPLKIKKLKKLDYDLNILCRRYLRGIVLKELIKNVFVKTIRKIPYICKTLYSKIWQFHII